MKHNLALSILLAACFLLNFGPLPAQKSTSLTVHATSLVERSASGDRQVCVAHTNKPVSGSLILEISMPGRNLLSIPLEVPEEGQVHFTIPKLHRETSARVMLKKSGILLSDTTAILKPPRTWTVYDVQVSHHDLGYADYYHMMRRDVREWGIELALENCRKTDNWPKESRFHWTVETSEPMTGFLQYQPDSVISELTRRIREGRIELGGLHNSVSTEHMSYEVLARAFYTPNRYIVDWMGIPPSRVALDTDVVGFVRSLPLFTKEADIPYFMMGINSTVIAFDQAYRDAAWYWEAPDRDPKKTLFKTWPYYSPDRLMAYDPDEISSLVSRYENRTDYPYDCILAEDSYDFGLPEMTNVEKIRSWNERYSNPVLVSATFSMFFDDISSQQKERPFSTYELDAPNAWADEDLADAWLEGRARNLGYRIPAVEKLSALVTATGGGCYPWTDLYQAYNRLLMYHEHTNGAYAEGPIYVPPSLKDSSAANANYYEVEQEMHRTLVDESLQHLEKAELSAQKGLTRLIPTGNNNTIAVINPLNYSRSDAVTFKDPSLQAGFHLVDNTSGETVACQQWPDGSLLFIAREVPQTGYKTYSVASGGPGPLYANNQLNHNNILENRYYRITFDPETGGISSLFDKELRRELVDTQAPSTFNEYLYQRYETTRYSSCLVSYKPSRASLSKVSGKLASRMESKVDAIGCESIVQQVILYEDIRRIDFILHLDKSPSGRSLDDYRQGNARNKEALFYSLPFAIPDFTIRHELPGAVVEPIRDQFNGSSTDFYAIQHFTDLSNDDFGVTLATLEAPLVEYGSPRPASWSRGDDYEHLMKKPDNSRVYLYLLNNMFFTNIRMSQPGPMTFRWSIRSHSGNWKEGKAYRFGWETAHPLEALVLPAGNTGTLPSASYSFMTLDRDNVVCTTLKPSESNGSGYIFRFFELTGEKTQVQAVLPFAGKIRSANETNLTETDRPIPVTVTGMNQLTFTIEPHGVKTIRILPEETTLAKIEQPTAKALSDRQIQLNWKHPVSETENIAFYRIYRSLSPQAEPVFRNYIGSTDQTSFIDQPVLQTGGWTNTYVNPATRYYYSVSPVTRMNVEGPASEPVTAVTLPSDEMDLPPGRVEGLRVVSVSPITDHNYLSLFFYSRIEDDVTGYRIYRSEHPGFTPSGATLIGEIDASARILHTTPHGFNQVERSLSEYTHQMYADESVTPNLLYHYKVCAFDKGGNLGEPSLEASGKAVLNRLTIDGNRYFFDEGTVVTISPYFPKGPEVRYTTDGTTPSRQSPIYREPITLTRATQIRAAVFYPGSDQPHAGTEASFSRALYPAPKYHARYAPRWAGSGNYNLVDGQKGDFWNDGFWQGFEYHNLDVVIDLGQTTRISSVSLGCFQFLASWIFLPEEVQVLVSDDGETFVQAGRIQKNSAFERIAEVRQDFSITFDARMARFVRVIAVNKGTCPAWHLGAGGKAWIFADEVVIH